MLLYILLLAVVSLANPIIRVDQEYIHDAPVSSWITIQLAHPVSTIKSIKWCKSITPNPVKLGDRVPPPIDDCKGAGLTHLQLYPNKVRILPEEPNVVYIDPEEIGGWDAKHQFDIIVEANVKERSAELLQVVKFNSASKPGPNGPGLDPSPTPAAGPIGPTAEEASALSSNAPTSGPTGPEVGAEVAAESATSTHPWPATLIVFGTGLALLLAIGLVSFARRRHTANRNYGQTSYAFDKLPSETTDVEMEDMSVLMRLGKGANAAFEMNLVA